MRIFIFLICSIPLSFLFKCLPIRSKAFQKLFPGVFFCYIRTILMPVNMKKAIFAILILPVMAACGGQKPVETPESPYESLMISNDISNQKVSSFTEDEQGHIWIGTFRGLNRFNVHEYHQYFCADDSLSLPDNQILCLLKDSSKRLWVGTVNGVCRYTDRDNFKHIPIESSVKNISQIIEDRSGRIFINTVYALQKYNPETESFETVLPVLDYSRSPVNKCLISPDNDLWIVNTNNIRHYDQSTMALKDSIAATGYPTYSYMSKDGQIWMNSIEGIKIFDTRSKQFMTVPEQLKSHPVLKKAYVTYIYPYNENTLLINTEKHGLFLYDRQEGSVQHQSESGFPFTAPDFKINCMYMDSQKNLWIGSVDQGYSVIYNYKERFNSNSYLRACTENMSVISLDCDRKGNLWISTLKDGLYVYNTSTMVFREAGTEHIFPSQDDRKTDINIVFIDRDDNVWLTSSGFIAKCSFDGQKLKAEKYFQTFYPMAMEQDDKGTVWIATASEYVCYLKQGDTELNYLKPVTADFTFIPAIQPYRGDKLFVGALMSRLKEIDTDSFVCSDAKVTEEGWKNSIRRSVFIPTDMHVDENGEVWIGTVANGLLRYNPATGEMSQVPGSPCTDISSIEEDVHGNLWVSTLYGLGKYDRSVKKFINWFEADGIGGNQFYDRASCRLSDGTLVFGGTHGLTFFNPIDVIQKRTFNLCFEDLKVHNELMRPGLSNCLDKSLTYGADIRLKYEQNNFSISFAALEYGEFERVRYFYMLEGFDKYWIDAHNNREAYYANLPPGNYTFKVRVTNNDQTMVEAENSLNVTVEPPVWLSWWALCLYAILLMAVFYAIMRFRRHLMKEKIALIKEREEKEQEMKVNKMNMSFFANISHEFRTPLTMISGPVTQLQESEDMTEENKRLLNIIQRNIRRMLRLVNQLLDFNKLENDTLKLQVKKTDVIEQFRNLADIFMVTANEKGVTFNTYGLEDSFMMWADEDKLDKICFNLLSNAMKFTSSGGKIEFILDVVTREDAMHDFTLKDTDTDSRWLKILVKDTGPGIPDDQLQSVFERYYQLENQTRGIYNWGTGIGLYFAKTLAEMHHGYLKAGNRTTGTGAVFTLLLPASESSYAENEKAGTESDRPSVYKISSVKYTEKAESADSGEKKTVLVVDDDADVIHYMKELLSVHYNVLTCFDVDSAYAVMKEKAPDLVLSDVVMPGTTGFEFCRKIKDNIQLSHIPVILLTAKATVEDQVQGLGCGADAYVTKPFEPQYLLALTASQLKNKEKIRAMLGESTAVENLEEDVLSPQDNAFMTELYQLMENELSNSELDVARMTEMLHISRTKFYYKVKGLTGENPSVFFKRYKLNRAAQLIRERKYNVSEIADMTGFSTLSHFSTSFKKQFGVSPSEYVK